jgi:putative endonuclease
MLGGWIYILVSKRGVLYVGVTSDLYHRVLEHRNGIRSVFASKHGCYRLVYFERLETITAAISREKEIKGWIRAKKRALVESTNPEWRDLAERWGREWLTRHQSLVEETEKHRRRIKLKPPD